MAERASSVAKTATIGDAYRIDSLSKTKAPAGAAGKDWYRYVIIQGDNTIVGHRQGSQRAVKQAVDEIERDQVVSRWCDSSAGEACDVIYREDPSSAIIRDRRVVNFGDIPPAAIYQSIAHKIDCPRSRFWGQR